MTVNTQPSLEHGNSDTTRIHGCVPLLTTVNTITPTTFFSIPVATNKCVYIEVVISGVKSDYTMATAGSLEGTFSRGSGNIIQQGTSLLSLVNSFTGVKPTAILSANMSTQSIDVILTGAPTFTVNWT